MTDHRRTFLPSSIVCSPLFSRCLNAAVLLQSAEMERAKRRRRRRVVLLLVVEVVGVWGEQRRMELMHVEGWRAGRLGGRREGKKHEKHAKKESDGTKGQRKGIKGDQRLLVRDSEEFMGFKKWGGEKGGGCLRRKKKGSEKRGRGEMDERGGRRHK